MKNLLPLLISIFYFGNLFAAPPTVTAIAPASAASGMTVVITGTDFINVTAVKFGATAARSFVVVSATRINAVVATGSSGSVEVTTADGVASRAGFSYVPTSGIITDYGGFWKTTGASVNAVAPDTSHHLLSFTYDDITYSTGVNDALLTSQSVTFTPGNFKALPVAGINGNTVSSGSSVFIALAKKVDGSANVGNASAVSSFNVMKALTDGVNGLDLGTGVTNLPASAAMTFKIHNINPAATSDAEPDLILTQIAQPSAGNDIFSFVDAAGNLVGNTKTQDMTQLPLLGSYQLDLFNLTPTTPYTIATAYSFSTTGSRDIRLTAFKLSDFGITAANVAQVRALKIEPSTNSDYAFIAYNASSINLPPNVSKNAGASTESICSGGTTYFEVVGAASSGGTLSYSWEEYPAGGSAWSVLSSSATYQGVNTNRLTVVAPQHGSRYRVRVTETGNPNTAYSDEFTVSVVSPAPPSAVSISGGGTVCRNTPLQLTSTVTGGTTYFYQWQQQISGVFTNIASANNATYTPPVNQAGSTVYRLQVSGASGCAAGVTSGNSTVAVTGVASTTPAAVCTGAPVTLTATSTSGTIDWFAADAGGASLFSGNSYTPATPSASTTYYAVSSVCASALRVPVVATVYPLTSAGSISGGTSVASGNNSTTLSLQSNNGTVIKWQSSTDNFNASVNDINNITTQYTATNLTQNTQFRAQVQSGTCPAGFSSPASITMFITLAVSEKSIKVYSSAAGATVQWSATSDADTKHFSVERSVDGNNFSAVTTIAPRHGSAVVLYQWNDEHPVTGKSYYRIKEVKLNGAVSYSETAALILLATSSDFKAFPNPVNGSTFSLVVQQALPELKVSVVSNSGQNVFQKLIRNSTAGSTININLPSGLSRGNYKLVIQDRSDVKKVINIVVL